MIKTEKGRRNLLSYNQAPDTIYTYNFSKQNGKYISITGEEEKILHKSTKMTIKACFIQEKNQVTTLTIEKIKKGEEDNPVSISLPTKDIKVLREFLDFLLNNDLQSLTRGNIKLGNNLKISDDTIKKLSLLAKDENGYKLVKQMIQEDLTKEDIVSIGYRKRQLEIFKNMLTSDKKEKERQVFFEKNPRIFGYGLGFLFNEPLAGKKLEQVVCGADINTEGKRADGVLKSKGVINAFCLVEIKHHKTRLLSDSTNSYRPGVRSPSDELCSGVAQSQKTVQRSIENIKTCFYGKDKNGNPTGEKIYNYLPKSYLIIGNLNEFVTENGINDDKYSSFELYRRNIHNPEIITFDELYERAKFIVSGNKSLQEESLENPSEIDDELPF